MRRVLKKLAGIMLNRLGLAHVVFWAHRLIKGRPVIVVFTYHRIVVRRYTDHYYTDYDRGLDARIFRVHLEHLRRFFDIVDLSTFIQILRGTAAPRSHVALLTFDDADSEFFTHAMPRLHEFDMPAVVMAPAGLVESTCQLWHVRMSNLIMSVNEKQWEVLQSRRAEWPADVVAELHHRGIANETERRETCRAINRALDRVSHTEIDRMIEAWEEIVAPARHLDVHCMSWDELRTLEASKVSVESHTVNHLKLTRLDRDALMRELVESKATLEQRLNKTVQTIAYPQGYFNADVIRATREAGYSAGFTTVRGTCRCPVSEADMFEIPRMDIYGDTPDDVTLSLVKTCLGSLMDR